MGIPRQRRRENCTYTLHLIARESMMIKLTLFADLFINISDFTIVHVCIALFGHQVMGYKLR